MRIIIAGGRDFKDKELFYETMEGLEFIEKDSEIISGMASGADTLGKEYALKFGLKLKEMPAKWNDMSEPCVAKYNKYNKPYNALAGYKRNEEMAKYASKEDDGLLVAFWDYKSSGTKNMIDLSYKYNLMVLIFKY